MLYINKLRMQLVISHSLWPVDIVNQLLIMGTGRYPIIIILHHNRTVIEWSASFVPVTRDQTSNNYIRLS